MNMRVSQSGIEHIKKEEGLRLKAYQDSIGKWTIGWGHTPNVKKGDVISKEQAEAFLKSDISKIEVMLDTALKVPVSQNQYDALIGIGINIGVSGLRTSTLLKKLNAGDIAGAANEFLRWDKVTIEGKKIVDPKGVLPARRAREMAMFIGDKISIVAKTATDTAKKSGVILTGLAVAIGFFLLKNNKS